MKLASLCDPALRLLGAAIAVVALVLSTPVISGSGNANAASDTEAVFNAVVGVTARVPSDARTARTLGGYREGNGIIIDDNGLVLTIGYLILEASSAMVIDSDGREIPAALVAYDHETGFGLVRALVPLTGKPLPIGDSSKVEIGDPALAVSQAGPGNVVAARIADRRPFAGYWEYLLENAIFTSPPHPSFGGAALISMAGELLGIGSLIVNDADRGPPAQPGNMFVPINDLKPIFEDLVENGKRTGPPRPWLGMYTGEAAGRVYVAQVVPGGPADQAGVKTGDIIMRVGGDKVSDMVDFYRKVWSLGDAGTEVPIDIAASKTDETAMNRIVVRSGDRLDWLRMDRGL